MKHKKYKSRQHDFFKSTYSPITEFEYTEMDEIPEKEFKIVSLKMISDFKYH
jgi:hypothetical protein